MMIKKALLKKKIISRGVIRSKYNISILLVYLLHLAKFRKQRKEHCKLFKENASKILQYVRQIQ